MRRIFISIMNRVFSEKFNRVIIGIIVCIVCMLGFITVVRADDTIATVGEVTSASSQMESHEAAQQTAADQVAEAQAATNKTFAENNGIEVSTPTSEPESSSNNSNNSNSSSSSSQSIYYPTVVTPVTSTVSASNAILTVDLVIFAGQSNMSGAGGDAKSAPAVANGHGYEFRNGRDPAGLYQVVEPFGSSANGYLCDPEGMRSGTLVSSFMNTYYSKTGVPVLGVSAARGGTDLNYWNKAEVQADLLNKYRSAVAWCNSNNVRVRRQYIVWLQGETDAIGGVDGDAYQTKLKNVFSSMFASGIEQVFVITIGNFAGLPGAYDSVVAGQIAICATDSHFTLGTDVLHTLPETYTPDTVHYNQQALNLAGSQAAMVAANYTRGLVK